MREYSHIDKYLNDLDQDIYEQPPDENHTRWAQDFINVLNSNVYEDVLDVGCGQGFTYPMFSSMGKRWTGITLGEDYKICKQMGLNVYRMDFTFTTFADKTFDLVFARHVLEHSVMPLLTLMEWRRVSRHYLAVVLPSPKQFKYFGKNHYSVMNNTQFLWLAARAGWKAFYKDYTEPMELRYILEIAEQRIEYPYESEADLMNQYGEI